MNRRITRGHALIGGAALLCVLVVPLTATGSGGGSGAPEATASGVKKQIKKLKRKVKKLQQQVDEIELQPGPQGPPGEQGVPGQDATKLFAYIGDGGDVATATVRYGSGVTAVSDPAGHSDYQVTFNRSLVNCVAQAVPGFGDPTGVASQANSSAQVLVNGDQAKVTFIDPAGTVTDTAFLITAFC